MTKTCIFVEGQTERIFLKYLIEQYLSPPTFTIDSVKLISNKLYTIKSSCSIDNTDHYFLIFDVSNDSKVLSAIIERSQKMVLYQGYTFILGIRDLYPNKKHDKTKVLNYIKQTLHNNGLSSTTRVILAIMEIEAWFLADYSFFRRIDDCLQVDYISQNLGIDISTSNPEDYNHPSKVIDQVLTLIGSSYKKKEKDVYRICHRLDYAKLCLDQDLHSRVPSLDYLIRCLNEALDINNR
ncbi:MAG: DUF4276 family protein [Spirochaetes bacterium]|nr:DUF4276 family protein [Spirochaetota bacterium]